MIKRLFTILAAALILNVSCAPDLQETPSGNPDDTETPETPDEPDTPENPSEDYLVAAASFELLSIDNAESTLAWSEESEIAVINTDGIVEVCKVAKIEEGVATFEVPANVKYAIYPAAAASSYDSANNRINYELAANVDLMPDDQVPFCTLVANLVKGENAGEATLTFRHICGYGKVSILGNEPVKTISLKGNTLKTAPLAGKGTVDLSATEPVLSLSTETSSIICGTIDADATSADGSVLYFALPAGTYEDLNVLVTTATGSYSISLSEDCTITRSGVTQMAAINLDELGSPINLSNEGIANCYIVPQGGSATYSFKTQKINSSAPLADIAYAQVLWASNKGLISDVAYKNGEISFTYAGNNQEGNALVVAADATNNVVWSWHIWCTDTPETVLVKGSTDYIYGVMDRNLGATYAPKSVDEAKAVTENAASEALGLYYQYGRPTPFPRPGSIKYTETKEVTPFGQNSAIELFYALDNTTQKLQFSTTQEDYDTALVNPSRFYCIYYADESGTAAQSSHSDYSAWYTSPYNAYNDGMMLWHSPRDSHNLTQKSDLDPCPAGYVMDDGSSALEILKTLPAFNRVGWGPGESEAYGYYRACPITDDLLYFPASGWRRERDGGYTGLGNAFHLWYVPSNQDKGNLRTYHFYLGTINNSGVPAHDSYHKTAQGINVRCRVANREPLQDQVVIKPKKRVSLIGDSISTFEGYINGNRKYYPHKTVNDVSQTYWYKLIYNYMSDATFDTNIAWSGSFVSRCTDSNFSDKHYYEQDFCARIRRQGMGNPDVILVHGGTNDSGGGEGWVKLYKNYTVEGTAIPTESEFKDVFASAAAATTLDAAYALDDTSFVTAYVKMLRIFNLRYPNAKVVMLIGDHVIASCRNSILAIGEYYRKQCGYRVVDFQDISAYKENKVITKVSSSHPDENGFEVMASYIYQQVGDYLESDVVVSDGSSQVTDMTEINGAWN